MRAAACLWPRQGPSEAKQCHTVAAGRLLSSSPAPESTAEVRMRVGGHSFKDSRSAELPPKELLFLSGPQLRSMGATQTARFCFTWLCFIQIGSVTRSWHSSLSICASRRGAEQRTAAPIEKSRLPQPAGPKSVSSALLWPLGFWFCSLSVLVGAATNISNSWRDQD